MQIKLFNIPIGAEDAEVETLNHFLRANKIIDIRRELAIYEGNSCWTFCVTYMLPNKPSSTESGLHDNTKRVDYKNVLEPDIFDKFSNLRKIRKQIAEREAIPAYAIFTDAELAEMARLDVLTAESIKKIPGIGKKKAEKYGGTFEMNIQTIGDEKSGLPDGTDSES